MATITASFGIFALSVASSGWLLVDLRAHERVGALAASLPMIHVEWRSVNCLRTRSGIR